MRERPFIVHFRNHKDGKIVGNGGATVSFVPIEDGKCKVGVSICHMNDTFNKSLGIEIATGRAKKYGEVMPMPNSVPTYIEVAKAAVAQEVVEKYNESISLERVAKMKTPAEINGIYS
jgi:hypothetical protein